RHEAVRSGAGGAHRDVRLRPGTAGRHERPAAVFWQLPRLRGDPRVGRSGKATNSRRKSLAKYRHTASHFEQQPERSLPLNANGTCANGTRNLDFTVMVCSGTAAIQRPPAGGFVVLLSSS